MHIGAKVCFFCGVSTLRGPRRRRQRPIQSYLLTKYYIADHPNIIEYANHIFNDRLIIATDRICRPCLQRADRYVLRARKAQEEQETAVALQQPAIIDVLPPSNLDLLKIHQPSETQSDPLIFNTQIDVQNVPMKYEVFPEDIPQAQEMPPPATVPLVPVPGFKCIPFCASKCIIPGCRHKTLHRINLMVRKHILLQQNIYVPHGVRVCDEHLEAGAWWKNLTAHCHPTDTFSSAQVADMSKILQENCLTYLNLDDINSALIKNAL
ncbi:unnamed protein product, partial [Brenthis ino]